MKWLIALIVAHLAVVSIGARIQNKRVVIVGGGVAGLAACQRLVQTYGITDLVLLEAGSQLGGRVNSYQLSTIFTIQMLLSMSIRLYFCRQLDLYRSRSTVCERK